MEKSGKKSKMEAHERSGGRVQLTMDDISTGPGHYGGAPGIDSREDLAVALGIGESGLRHTAARGRWILDVGEYSEGCRIVAPERDPCSYPCFHCPGGTDFDRCAKTRQK